VRALVLQANGEPATGGFDAAILTWDLGRGRPTTVRRGHVGAVDTLVALPNGCLLSGSEEGRLGLWCGLAPGRFVDAHGGRIAALAHTGSTLASAAFDGTVKLWSLASDGLPTAPRTATTHAAPVAAVAVRTDGAVVSGSHDGEVRLTHTDGRMISRALQLPVTVLAAVGDRVVVGLGDGRLQMLAADLTPGPESELIDGPPTALAVTSDGRTAVVASARTPVTVVDLTGRSAARALTGTRTGGPVWTLALTADERQVLTAGADGILRLWTLDGSAPRGVAVTTTAAAPAELRAGDEDGARVFRACSACHTTRASDPPRAGPTLAGIMGRRIGTAPGYAFSPALAARDLVWTPETIARLFEVGPATYLPGTTMPEQRITDPDDRRALVEWLARITR
jgi:cytochrome c